ncbi:TenA family transcriptional regulator [Peristeroidobacter agariperforans]|uniref:TenA family transcriptional regulator n=1 Tax=Peristeroidobacter agariperforans TaxID=268404 RepID=UPI00101CE505|nr:iron-containing redox enzyme family protein [Peristeroidobacter agariperforans]
MQFNELLASRTAQAREYLTGAPIIQRALAGQIERDEYIAFLTQAFHHVRHTVPLLMAVGSRLPARLGWLRKEIIHYTEEEEGHEQWILNDIQAAGGNAAVAADSLPSSATDAMVAYAYDTATRRNPVGFFGMVFVLEGASVALACNAADRIQASLQLPSKAMTYLRSHGQLDQQHVQDLYSILNRFDEEQDRAAVGRCAQVMFRLYGNIFYELDRQPAVAGAWRAA